jgi:hypothetical protein
MEYNDLRVIESPAVTGPHLCTAMGNSLRLDAKGTQIKRGSKQHCVTFKEHLEEIYYVENWKRYHMDHLPDDERCCQLL